MPPMRTMSLIKPVKTERSHEENQEVITCLDSSQCSSLTPYLRAYIAASRRSDRSLEARVESARRASEIHKRRTGRSLRATEQDVVNEEMYEEEDDDLPMQYRRLTAHLQSQNIHLDRRLQAYVAQQVAMRTGGWANNAFAGNDPNQFSNSQFMNPNMMQMQQPAFQQHPLMPPQQMHRMQPNYRQSPYPMPNQQAQGARPQWHNRSASIATPQGYPAYQQQQNSSSIDLVKTEDRRMSMPAQQVMTPQSHHGIHPSASQQNSSVVSRKSSLPHATTPHGHAGFKQSPQQISTPPGQVQQDQQNVTSPCDADFEQQLQNGSNPLSMSLPTESQQLLSGSNAFDTNDHMSQMLVPSQVPSFQPGMKQQQQQQPLYSYKPNAKPRSASGNSVPTPTGNGGLSQTSAPSSLDTSVGNNNNMFNNAALQSGANDYLNTPLTPVGLGLDGDANASFDAFSETNGGNSGQVTPDEDWMANMLQEGFFDTSVQT
ncbi:hypothetical protein D0869_07188 [Hortaea werneckii]|uniref:Uncharacterized protein n=1 Tax=Hortaea werneckii TaxID=91943 RepID=A0A3M6WQU6_HORWE|nr:hypothetical protein KC324_g13405 [Hortaea werneckii]KAI7556684.1 hypothetical protein KC316_g13587 [Hortaea werneckii]RMX80935.1 hypothetical protein D0869_07188 [Hortaea werneckii]